MKHFIKIFYKKCFFCQEKTTEFIVIIIYISFDVCKGFEVEIS